MWKKNVFDNKIIKYVLDSNHSAVLDNVVSKGESLANIESAVLEMNPSRKDSFTVCNYGRYTFETHLLLNPTKLRVKEIYDGLRYTIHLDFFTQDQVGNLVQKVSEKYAELLNYNSQNWLTDKIETFEKMIRFYRENEITINIFSLLDEVRLQSLVANIEKISRKKDCIYHDVNGDIYDNAVSFLHRAKGYEKHEQGLYNAFFTFLDDVRVNYEMKHNIAISSVQRGRIPNGKPIAIRADFPLVEQELKMIKPSLVQLVATLPILDQPFESRDYYLHALENGL